MKDAPSKLLKKPATGKRKRGQARREWKQEAKQPRRPSRLRNDGLRVRPELTPWLLALCCAKHEAEKAKSKACWDLVTGLTRAHRALNPNPACFSCQPGLRCFAQRLTPTSAHAPPPLLRPVSQFTYPCNCSDKEHGTPRAVTRPDDSVIHRKASGAGSARTQAGATDTAAQGQSHPAPDTAVLRALSSL